MRLRSILAGSALAVACVLSAAPPAVAAVPRVMITKIYFDSPGRDTSTNASINAERIVLKNTTSRRIDLRGWTIRDANGHVYRFGTYRLGAGRTVVLHSGRGRNAAGHRFWGHRHHVWNNTTDTARLRGPAGRLRDSCSYRGPNDRSAAGAMTFC